MAKRIVVMSEGQIEQLGSPLDIYRKPISRFVAGFFGTPTMNFLGGEIVAENGGPVFVADSIKAPLANGMPASLAGRKATLGVRSEHVIAGGQGGMAGRVNLIEPLGDATLVFLEYGGGSRLVAKVDPDRPVGRGDKLSFAFDAENCHLFDADSGARLN